MTKKYFDVVVFGFVSGVQCGRCNVVSIKELTLSVASHFLLSFGLPLTVLCHTMGKLVFEQKF